MTVRRRRIVPFTGAAILMVSLAVGYASAQNTSGAQGPFSQGGRGRGGPGGPGRPGPGGPMLGLLPMFATQLDLSDSQRDTLKTIAASHSEEWKGLADRERKARDAVRTAVTADSLDEAAIRQRIVELSTVEADVAVARARVRQEFVQVLTADQKARLKTIESRRPEERGRRGRPA